MLKNDFEVFIYATLFSFFCSYLDVFLTYVKLLHGNCHPFECQKYRLK